MSRFFNQTKKALDWSLRESVTEDPEVGRVLEAIKEVDSRVVDVPKSRFYGCRKFELAPAAGQPLVLKERISRGLAGEAYRGLRTRLMRLQARQGTKSIVISSTLPGEGKTLTTMNLALSFASLHDVSVLIVDADLRTCGLSELIGKPSGPGVAEVLQGTAKFHDAIVATDVRNLYVAPAGTLQGSAPELFANAHWKEFMAWASEAFKVILVDAPSVLPLADFDLIASGCDGVLVVVRAQRTRRDALRKVGSQIDPSKLLGVVFNGTDNHNQDSHERYFNEEVKRK
jgi:capsular exopolysaccharide synthesis family protein